MQPTLDRIAPFTKSFQALTIKMVCIITMSVKVRLDAGMTIRSTDSFLQEVVSNGVTLYLPLKMVMLWLLTLRGKVLLASDGLSLQQSQFVKYF